MDKQKYQKMAEGGHRLAVIRDTVIKAVKVGVTGLEIEALTCKLIAESGGKAAFKRVPGYDFATCIAINEGVVHGIPNNQPFKNGDLVTVDLGLIYDGYYTDSAATTTVGKPSPLQAKLLDIGNIALQAGIDQARVGNHVSDISRAVQKIVEEAGFSVIRDLTGHGVGKRLHEDPYIPNYYEKSAPDPVLYEGQTLAIEPMFAAGKSKIRIGDDGWTIVTADGSLATQAEHTIIILKDGPQILTV